jgi:hypothetical protein
MKTPNRKIVEETEYGMLHDEEFILLSDSRPIKDGLFPTLSVTVKIRDNFPGINYKCTCTFKYSRIIRVMLGLRQTLEREI